MKPIFHMKMNTEKKERIQKFLSRCGLCSRRGGEDLICAGRVSVNGVTVTEMGLKVGPDDKVEFDGRVVQLNDMKAYYLFYKPRGMLTSMADPHHANLIARAIENLPERVYPVGRLDKESEGLLLLTNDGELANALMHPARHVEKEYMVVVDKALSREEERSFSTGVPIHGGEYVTSVCSLKRSGQGIGSGQEFYSVTIAEGKKRQIREMFAFFKRRVLSLKRVRIGPLSIGCLEPGEIRSLSAGEIKMLKEEAGLCTSRKS